MRALDINADLGESPERWVSGEDIELFRYVTSANVCCGAYAGDDGLMEETCRVAVESHATIGAQVGFPDREGFGRRLLDMAPNDLTTSVTQQIERLQVIAARVGGRVAYVKPHGALYNAIVSDETYARAVIDGVSDSGVEVLLGLPGSVSLRVADDAGLTTVHEGFADRAYQPDGTLRPRTEPGAVITDPDVAAAQAVRLASTDIDTLCVHSDSPDAVRTLKAVRRALESAGIAVEPFVR